MLTIKAPIELHSMAFQLRDDGGFAERIRGDYMLMGTEVSAQSLTHLLHTPPEIIVAEGGEGGISSTTNIYAFREEQQTVLNNVMNRVLLSNRFGFTYQDRVYITDVLHKLGIRDERRFMEEVRQLLSETDNSRQLTDLYVEHIGELRTMLALTQQYTTSEETDETSVTEEGDENRLYLDIMNRLQTGAIYQIVNNMLRSTGGSVLNNTEVLTSEQTYTARQLLLSRFREMAVGEKTPLIYRAENVFEEETRMDIQASEREIREKITSAVLLEVIRSFDHAISTRSDRNVRTWMNLHNSYYQAGDNALTRILVEAREHRSAAVYETTQLSAITQSEYTELALLREITSRGEERLEELMTQAERFASEETYLTETERERLIEEQGERTLREGTEIRTEREFRESSMEYLESESQETVLEEVERINRQNTENLERYRQMREILAREMQRDRHTVSDRERTMRESLRVLMDRDHLKELLAAETPTKPSELNQLLERIYAQLPAESVEIFRQMEQQRTTGALPGQASVPELVEQELVHFVEGAAPEAGEEEQVPATMEYREAASEEAPAAPAVDITMIEMALRQLVAETPAGVLLTNYSTLVTGEIREQERIFAERERVLRQEIAPAQTEILRLTLADEMGAPLQTAEIRTRRGTQPEISFVHRQEPHLTEEDVRETLEQYRRSGEQRTKVVEEAPRVTEVHREAPQIVNQTVHSMTREESEEIAELVERGIRRQLNTIAGEVYTRLEKRLRTEKSRRGI